MRRSRFTAVVTGLPGRLFAWRGMHQEWENLADVDVECSWEAQTREAQTIRCKTAVDGLILGSERVTCRQLHTCHEGTKVSTIDGIFYITATNPFASIDYRSRKVLSFTGSFIRRVVYHLHQGRI